MPVVAMALISILFVNASCDSHEAIDKVNHIGYVLCSDHTCMSLADFEQAEGKTAVGVVFAEKTEDHPTLVVSLDEYYDCFCDSAGMENNTSASLTAYDGNTNTVAMQACYTYNDSLKIYQGCPIAMKPFSDGHFGQSLYIPSVAEMRLLTAVAPSINSIIQALKGQTIKLDGNCWYWTSTEVNGNTANQAWLCSAKNGGIQETPKSESHRARAIVQLNYPGDVKDTDVED